MSRGLPTCVEAYQSVEAYDYTYMPPLPLHSHASVTVTEGVGGGLWGRDLLVHEKLGLVILEQ